MDLSLTPEHREIQKAARRFFQAEVMPHATAVDRLEKDLIEFFPRMGEQGFLAPNWPEEYGGAGLDAVGAAIIAIEAARACGSTSLSSGASVLLAGGAILAHGTGEQKRRYLPPIAAGEKVGAWGLTEPGAGSDVAGTSTRAREVEGGFLLNGAKTFITNAPVADTFVIYAWTDEKQGHRGMSAFIVERGAAGLETSPPMHKMGFRGSPTGEIFLHDCFVPKENLLGTRGLGFYEAADGLNAERSMVPCVAIGLMERALELSLKYARERHAFGKPIATFQAIQMKLARMYVDIEHARSHMYRLLWMKEQGIPFVKEASAAKVFCAEASVRNTLEAIQILGGYGYTEEYEVERLMRDAKLLEIGAGTTEIQLLLVGRMLVGQTSQAEQAPQPEAAPETPTPRAEPDDTPPIDARTVLKKLAESFRPQGAPDWKASILFDLEGPGGGTSRLIVSDGTCRIEDGGGDADTTLQTTVETWNGIVSGSIDPQKAFLTGRLKVTGSISNAMMLSNPRVFVRSEGAPA